MSLGGDRIGPLADLLVDREGRVGRVVVSAPDGLVELEPEPSLAVGEVTFSARPSEPTI